MIFADRLTVDAPKRLRDGYMAVRARAARTGVYDYAGSEVDPENEHGLRDTVIVKVLRDDKTVFDTASARSFIGKPITDNHPAEPVTADNWRDHARGTVMGAMKEGEYLAFDLLLTDSAAITAVENGKRELSNGYAAELEFGDFTAPDGTKCQARQTKVSGNHVALVDRGRAGSECAIKDVAVCDAITADRLAELADLSKGNAVKKIVLDGLQVDLSDADAVAAAFDKLQGQITDANEAKAKAETDLATVTTDKANLEAKVTTLEKQVADAKLTPAQLRDAAKSYSQTVDKAKALGVTVSDDADEATIRKAVVDAKMGDLAKDWNDDQIAASFASIAKDAGSKVEGFTPAAVNDAATTEVKALNDSIDNLNAWRTQRPAAA